MEREWREERGIVRTRRCGGEEQDSPEGPAVVLEVLWLDVGEEEVWLTGGGKGLVLGILGRLGGNECVSSSSKGSG